MVRGALETPHALQPSLQRGAAAALKRLRLAVLDKAIFRERAGQRVEIHDVKRPTILVEERLDFYAILQPFEG